MGVAVRMAVLETVTRNLAQERGEPWEKTK